MGVIRMGFAEHSGLGWIQSPIILNFFLASFHYIFEVAVCILHIHSIKSVHTCIMKNLSKNWWVPGGLEPGTTDPNSGMFVPKPILEKAINFWSGLLKFKFQEFFTKKYYKNLHEVYKKESKENCHQTFSSFDTFLLKLQQ